MLLHPTAGKIDSLIGATTRIEGNVVFSGGLRVDGMVRGNVASVADQPGTLVVSADARIDGEVQAAHIVVSGSINGPVHATETLELQAGTTPILAGETRDIALVANKPGDTENTVAVRFPITIAGKLEWGKSGSLPINQRFSP